MSKTIYYYNCFVKHNNQYTDLKMHDLVDEIYAVHPTRRFKSISNVGNLCMIGAENPGVAQLPNGQPLDYRIRKTVFAKYRENKPYLGNIGTDRLEEIMDDVLEATSVVFFPNSYLAAIEYNHIGARTRNIEYYLDSFLPSAERDRWSIEFIPIDSTLGFGDVQDSRSIREIEFKLDLTSADTLNVVDDLKDSSHRFSPLKLFRNTHLHHPLDMKMANKNHNAEDNE